jgi:hypothetical protein
MTAELESLVLEHLRAIRAKQDQHSERLDRIDLRLSVIEQTVGSLFVMAGSDRETMQRLTKRVERIERRLELTEG